MLQDFNSWTPLLYNFVGNSHVKDPGQSLINDNFTVVSIIKSENGTIQYFLK